LYHPNSGRGTEESKAALSEYFHQVHQAWLLLRESDKRRRYIQVLDLFDQHEAFQANTADLFPSERQEQNSHRPKRVIDGHSSSSDEDDDDDLPHIAGLKKRQTFDLPSRKVASKLADIPEVADDGPRGIKPRALRPRNLQIQGRVDSGRDSDGTGSDQNVSAERRKKFDRLRRKELEAFTVYRDAMINKFEAEEIAEQCKELFEQAEWRRRYFERAPRETSQRIRLIRLFNIATKAFVAQQKPIGRRKGSTAGGQILSTGDPLQSNQFLELPSRNRSIRRKGFSSDISADYTSSDEEYASDRPTTSKRMRASSPAPNHRRHRSGDSIPSSVRLTPRRLPNASTDPLSPVSGPGPGIFVRAATNIADMIESAETKVTEALIPSRSPSPEIDDPRRGSFKLLPNISTSEMFGIEKGRSRSLTSENHLSMSNGHGQDHHNGNVDATMFSTKQIGRLYHQNIPAEYVHELVDREKSWMLRAEPDQDVDDPSELLRRLAVLDHAAAAHLTVKADIKKDFRFRLVYNHRELNSKHHQSFIALSYRRKILVEKKTDHYTLPLDPAMFQAVWDERGSDNEGVWIDQICIDQDSAMEKNVSMSAMDMVYRSARLIVVALDDIELEAYEGMILENHMDDFNGSSQAHVPATKRFRRRPTPYLDTHYDLYSVIRKIMGSSWFRRAWCRHEMRLAKDHIFLVPCRSPGTWSERSVIRFTGKCLTHFLGLATEVAFEPAIEAVKPALYAFFRDRSKLSVEHHSHHGNFTTVVAEVFAMEAGGDPRVPEEQREADARKDKIAIILNTMECGLALRQHVRQVDFKLPIYECNYMLLLLALAARDPGALCSVGHPLSTLPYNLTSSWLLEPTNVDSGLNNYRTLNRLPHHRKIATHIHTTENYVTLDLKFVGQGAILRPLESPSNLHFAKHFLEVCERKNYGRNRKRYLLTDKTANHLFGSMLEVYLETLTCVFDCGPDWMSEVCQRYGVGRWKNDLQPAYDLMIAFKNTDSRWPESAWSSQGAGFILDFVNFLVIRGMPQRQTMHPEAWRPISVRTHDPSDKEDSGMVGRVLTFIPPGEIRVAVPAALLDSDYVHLARLFVMEPRGEYDPERLPHYSEWTLRGKSVLFSDDHALELLEAEDDGRVRGGQKVFGRAAGTRESSREAI